jgi:hypothetical protein
MELQAFLAWVISGGAATGAYFLVEKVKWLAALAPESKRWAAFGVSALLAMAAYTVAAFCGYEALPGSFLAWVEILFLVGTSSFGLATLLHAKHLRKSGV